MAQDPKVRLDPKERDRLYVRGLEAFNTGCFYEAHEHWEEVWLETSEPDKRFLQGLIQIAAAFHHHSRANLRGTRNLLHEGLLKLDRFPEVHGGLEIESLREAVRGCLAALAVEESLEDSRVPRIHICKGGHLSI